VCPACLGSGAVSTRLGYYSEGRYVPDAYWDAEALASMNAQLGGRGWSRTNVYLAGEKGGSAIWNIVRNPGIAVVRAREAASVAFRAVPMLRRADL
jgi:hypothetical protein